MEVYELFSNWVPPQIFSLMQIFHLCILKEQPFFKNSYLIFTVHLFDDTKRNLSPLKVNMKKELSILFVYVLHMR